MSANTRRFEYWCNTIGRIVGLDGAARPGPQRARTWCSVTRTTGLEPGDSPSEHGITDHIDEILADGFGRD